MTREDLIAEPTIDRWREELRQLIDGLRAGDVDRVGSVEEYVERLLFDTRRRNESESSFEEALNQIVVAWQPDRPGRPSRTDALLQLIAAYTPPTGFDKVCDFIEVWQQEDGAGPPDVHLRRRSLHAAARYFKVAPAAGELNVAFGRYVGVLRQLLECEPFSPHAFARLIEVSAIHSNETAVKRLQRPEFIRSLVDHFRPGLLAKPAANALTVVFALCVAAGPTTVESLVEALNDADLPTILEPTGLSISIRDGQRLVVPFPPDAMERYTMLRWKLALESNDWLPPDRDRD